jgi:hypothetical protein
MSKHLMFINTRKYYFADRVSVLERNWLLSQNRPADKFVLSMPAARSAYKYASEMARRYVMAKFG